MIQHQIHMMAQRCFSLVWLHSILHTYGDIFCDSTDVPKMFQSCYDLCYKLHFVLFHCDFLTASLTHWSRAPIYHLNNSISWEIVSTHFPLSAPCIQEMCTFCDVVPFCELCAFLQFQSDHTSEARPRHSEHQINRIIDSYHHHHVLLLQNAIVHIKSKEVWRTSTQVHQIWKPIVIQPHIQFTLVHRLYHWRIAEPGVNCLIFLSN